jgi:Sec-independent protein translocase protein TatA
MRFGTELIIALLVLILVFGWKSITLLMRGVREGIEDMWNGFDGGGRPRF